MTDGPIRLFPEIYNIGDFVCRDHPHLHPDTYKYTEYWENQEKFCVEGKWGHDYNPEKGLGGWRYMPGNLYFYINMWSILHTVGKARRRQSPNLRDVEWILSYAWAYARGFSGFEFDEEYTCNTAVLSPLTDDELIKTLGYNLKEEYRDLLINNVFHNGKRKKYMNAYEYLKQTFPKPLGRAVWGNPSMNLQVLGSRNFGKSFYTSGAIIGHEFIFDGHKYYDYEYLNKPNEVNIFVGAFASDKSSELLTMFKNGFANMPGSYGEGADYRPSYFFKNTSGNLDPNNKKTAFRHLYRAKQGGIWVDKGSKSSITHGIYTVDNPQAAVGSRYTIMVKEEIGLFRNLIATIGADNLCLTDGIDRFGSIMAIGTGGNMETIQDARLIFYDPKSYDFVGFANPFETGSNETGLFIPAYLALNQYKNELGNTDYEGAYKYLQQLREKARKASTAMVINDELMSRPIVPSEMFLSSHFSNFPIADLKERIAQLDSTSEWEESADIGTLEFVDKERKEVRWYRDTGRTLDPIVSTSLERYRGNYSGAMIIYEHPADNKPLPSYNNSLYKIVYDPVKDDKYGPSFASILVYKGYGNGSWEGSMQDNIVAECLMRTNNTEDCHDAAIKLAIYYGAKIMPETDIPDFVRYCKRIGLYHILQPHPSEAISKVLKTSSAKYEVGVSMVPNLGVHCEHHIANWLNQPYKEVDGKLLNNCYKLKSKRLLDELINYKREGNFDHISSLKVLMLWLSQEREVTQEEKDKRKDQFIELKKKLQQTRRENRMNVVKQIYYSY